LAAKRLIISSGVVPCGAVFSSGPSWASAGKAPSAPARNAKKSTKVPYADFILFSLSDKGHRRDDCLPTSLARFTGMPAAQTHQSQVTSTAATPPSNPSPLSEAGGKAAAVLPFTKMLEPERGCRGETGVGRQTSGVGSVAVTNGGLNGVTFVNIRNELSSWAALFAAKDLSSWQGTA
jgi:hypothetical protein